jgi:hypothetical protein
MVFIPMMEDVPDHVKYKLPHIKYPNEKKYWNCSLMGLMGSQIRFSRGGYDMAYIHSYKRIDEIWKRMMFDHGAIAIDTHLQRISLASHLRPIYLILWRYLEEYKPGKLYATRSGYLPFTVEFHIFHDYMTQNGFTEKSAYEFIAEDMSDPDKFEEIRQEVRNIYENGTESSPIPKPEIQSQNIVAIYPQSIERYRYLFSKPNSY